VMIATGVPVYIICVQWKNKPKSFTRLICKSDEPVTTDPCGPLELWNGPDPYSCPDGIKNPLNQSLVSFGLVYAYVSSFSCTVVIDCFVFLVELMFSFATVVRSAGKMGL